MLHAPRNSFYRVLRKELEWVMRKKGYQKIPEVFVRSVMSLYRGAKTSVWVDFEMSE